MGASFYGELIIRVTTDTSGVNRGLTETQSKVASTARTTERTLGKTGLAMQNIGRTMTQYYTLPVVAGLGYATYAAYKYQKAMIQVQNLTGLSAVQAAKFSDEIRQASAEIGNAGGPQAAAEAFYFLASSGLDAQEAMDALRVSMKASVAGMGEIQTLADVVTSAMNSYGHSAYTATEAMDVLMRTIEVGKAEPEALARSLGRIMPIANQLKVSLEELGGNVAALTLGGLSSAEAVTALRGTMVALVSPAKMSIDELKTLGLTYKEVTRSIAEKGLLPTLKMLWEATDHNMLSLRKIIPNVRATTGVMSLLGANYKKNLEVIERVNDSQGKLNETYKAASQTDVAQFNRALNQLKSTFIEVGKTMLPIVTMLVEKIGALVGVFSKLPPWLQEASVWFLAVTAAAMPLISVLGSVTRAWALLSATRAAAAVGEVGFFSAQAGGQMAYTATSLGSVGAAATSAVGPVLAITAAIAGLTFGIGYLADYIEDERFKQTLIPDFQVELFDEKAFKDEMERQGYMKRTIDGIVYWDYKVEARQTGTDPGKTVAEQIQRGAQRGADRVAATEAWLEGQVEKMVARAKGYGGFDALANVFGSGDPTKKWAGLAVRPRIMEYTAQIKELEPLVTGLAATLARGYGRPGDENRLAQMTGQLEVLKYRLAGVTDIWEKAQADVAHLQEMQPEWDVAAGRGKLREQLDQYLFDMKAYLSRNRKYNFIDPPQIDFGKGKFQNQIANLETWLKRVTKSREIPMEVKVTKVKQAIKDIEGELRIVKARAKREGWTTELKAKKDKLDAALDSAERRLRNLGKTTVTPTVEVSGAKEASSQLRDVADAAASIPKTIPINVSYTAHGYRLPWEEEAWGGIIRKPTIALVGEQGPEVVIPLTKERRATQLLYESGLAKYAQQPTVSGPAPTKAAAAAGQPVETGVHYHTHLTLPQGAMISDLDRFGRTISPYVERATMLTERRRERGRAAL